MRDPGKLFCEESLVTELHDGDHTPQTSVTVLGKAFFLIIRAQLATVTSASLKVKGSEIYSLHSLITLTPIRFWAPL